MHTPNPSHTTWRKSTYSSANGACVEVARLDAAIALRDSKDLGGGHLTLSTHTFTTFLTRLKHDNPNT